MENPKDGDRANAEKKPVKGILTLLIMEGREFYSNIKMRLIQT